MKFLDAKSDTDCDTSHMKTEGHTEELNGGLRERWEEPVIWHYVVTTMLIHAGCLAAPFYFSWSGLVVAVVLFFVVGCLGVTVGYHRMLTHTSFKTYRAIRYFLTLCGCMGHFGGPLSWVGTHRLHHARSDSDDDPHTPRHGLIWSHITYVYYQEPASDKSLDTVKDLQREPALVFLEKWSVAPVVLCLAGLYLAGELYSTLILDRGSFGAGLGLSWLAWGGFVRMTVMFHAAGSVNSVTHTYGYRNFDTPDNSRNLWWVALMTFGEGWHNNHHAQQRSAAHGMRWWEFDVSYRVIKTMQWLGLAWDVVEPKPSSSDSVNVSDAKSESVQ